MKVRQALEEFIGHTSKAYPHLQAVFDPDWRSPCEIGEPYDPADRPAKQAGERLIDWRPLPRALDSTHDDFAPLERALEITVHPDIKEYYGSFWSAGLEAEAVDGHVSLLFLWNTEDIARLNENLIGHALARKRWTRRNKRRPMSVFFACTEPDSELFLSIDNDSGAVLLEKPGNKPERQIAESLGDFLQTLVPRPPALHR